VTKKEIANWLLNPGNPGDLSLGEAEERLKQFGLEKIYNEVELPLIEVLAEMKKTGVKLDRKKIRGPRLHTFFCRKNQKYSIGLHANNLKGVS